MCDYDLIEYYQLLQLDSKDINKKLSDLDDKFSELNREVSVETESTEKLKETA